jgi:hypothetical protein
MVKDFLEDLKNPLNPKPPHEKTFQRTQNLLKARSSKKFLRGERGF